MLARTVWAKFMPVLVMIVTCLDLCLASVSPAQGAVAPPLSFGPAVQIDQAPPFSHTDNLDGVICPTTTLCVATDTPGRILTSTAPTATSPWAIVPVSPLTAENESRYGLGSGSCPSASFCGFLGGAPPGAAAGQWEFISSTDPGQAGQSWAVQDHAGGPASGPTSLSCPSVGFCVATNREGDMWTSSNPTAGADAWTLTTAAHTPGTIQCPAVNLCVGIDNFDDAYVSTDPAAGAGSWAEQVVAPGDELTGLTCATSATPVLCVAVSGQGHVLSVTDPAQPGATWKVVQAPSGFVGLEGVNCATDAGLCVIWDDFGHVGVSTNPTGDTSAWTETTQDSQAITDIDCVTDSLCLATDTAGNVLTANSPAGAAGDSWGAHQIDGFNAMTGLSCPTATMCLGVDDAGNLLGTASPTTAKGPWLAASIDTTALTALSCDATPLCVAGDAAGHLLTSSDPAGGPSTWTSLSVDPGHPITAVSCTIGPTCVAIDGAGNLFSSSSPTTHWNTLLDLNGNATSAGGQLLSVSCAGPSLCLVGEDGGAVLASTDPANVDATWSQQTVFTSSQVTALACPSARECLADAFGTVKATTAAPDGPWTSEGPSNPVSAIACATTTLCLEAEDGSVQATFAPTVPNTTGSLSSTGWPDVLETNGYWLMPTAACAPDDVCVVGDRFGNAWIGVAPPRDVSPPTIEGSAAVGRSLTCVPGGWNSPLPVSYAFAWYRDGVAVSDASTAVLKLSSADAGQGVACVVTASNSAGATPQASSPVDVTAGPSVSTTPGPAGSSGLPRASVTKVVAHEHSVHITVRCVGPVTRRCMVAVTELIPHPAASGRPAHANVTLAHASITVRGGHSASHVISPGRRLIGLLRFHRRVRVTVIARQLFPGPKRVIGRVSIILRAVPPARRAGPGGRHA